MVELRKIDVVKEVSRNVFISLLIIFVVASMLYYYDYEFKSILFNSVLLWATNYLLRFSMLVSALNFENLDEYKLNSNLDHLMQKEKIFIKEHPKLNMYNATVMFVSMMINIIIVIYLVVGLYMA